MNMTTENPAPAVPPKNPADDSENPKPNNVEALLEKNKKLLDEKKKAQEQLDTLLKEKEASERKKLEETQQWEKIAKDREEELKKLQADSAALKRDLEDGAKLQSFLDNVGGQIDRQYWRLIDVDAINIDPDSKLPDELSVKKAVEQFKKQYPLVIKTGAGPNMPNEAPNISKKLSYDSWKKLPYSEQKKRHDEVDWAKV